MPLPWLRFTITHDASRRRRRDRVGGRPSFEARVALAKHDALQSPVAGNQRERRREERAVVVTALRVEQMDAGDVALAALGGFESGQAADGEELRSHTDLVHLAEQEIEPDAMAADHDEVRKLQLPPEQLHADHRPGRNDLLVTADRGEAVGAAERRHAA